MKRLLEDLWKWMRHRKGFEAECNKGKVWRSETLVNSECKKFSANVRRFKVGMSWEGKTKRKWGGYSSQRERRHGENRSKTSWKAILRSCESVKHIGRLNNKKRHQVRKGEKLRARNVGLWRLRDEMWEWEREIVKVEDKRRDCGREAGGEDGGRKEDKVGEKCERQKRMRKNTRDNWK